MKKSDILEFIERSATPVSKRDVASALGLKGSGPRVAMKKILRELELESLITKVGGNYTIPEGLPSVLVVEVTEIGQDGDVIARPAEWDMDKQGEPPSIIVAPDPKKGPALGQNDRALVRMKRFDADEYEAKIIKRLDRDENQVLGMIRVHKSGHAHLMPADKKARNDFEVPSEDLNGAKDGDLVIGEVQPGRGGKRKKARIVQVLGSQDDPKAISLISLHEQGLREGFPETVEAATKDLKVPDLKGREDLRAIPLVTIDGADACDFDDAVYAEEIPEEGGGGFHIIVAIADVSYYVRPGKTLDQEAQARGNSTYFPDRVVPMLPEALSNDLCSLRPNENRACLAVHLFIDKNGDLKKYKFVRGIMRSAARLIYEDVQKALEKQKHDMLNQINPLYAAFEILDRARDKRGALELDLPERQIVIDKKGNMTGVKKRERLDAHKMIEEFMILANVAAAKALEDKRAPCVYRIHERPSLEKLDSVREFVESFGLSMPKGQVTQSKHINQVLQKAKDSPYSHLISTVMLRSQSQAVYSSNNQGHFGLALSKYAHFTSPIRRYADLLVHRSLIKAYGLGPGGLDLEQESRLDEICDHISTTERTSMAAERSAVDRFTASFLSEQIGAEFEGRITGVTRFGLFVMLNETGADGIIPMRSLPDDYYIHDEKAHRLVGKRKGRIFQLGANVTVRLKEADGLSGSCVLELLGKGNAIPEGVEPPKARHPRHQKGQSKRGGPPKGKKKDFKKKKKTTPKHKRKAKAQKKNNSGKQN
ncbi:MAG: ribonuclease R [Pseudomonadota bacterium]